MKLSDIVSKGSKDHSSRHHKKRTSIDDIEDKGDKSDDRNSITLIQEIPKLNVALGRRIIPGKSTSISQEVLEVLHRKETIRKKMIEKHLKFTISSTNRYLRCFKNITSVLVWYSVIISLSYLAFNDDISDYQYIDDFIWAIFLIEFVIEHFTSYFNKKKEKVANFYLIFRHYFKKTFVIDLFSILPLRWFGHPLTEYLLRTLRIFKMREITKLFDIQVISSWVSKLFYIPGSFSEKRLKQKMSLIFDILIIAIKMILGTYFFACTWYSFSITIRRKNYEKIDFFEKYEIQNMSKGNSLMITWYFIFTTLATVGYGDLAATNKYEMAYAILLVLIGSTWFAFLMGKSVKIIESLSDLNGLRDVRISLNLWISNIEENYTYLPYKLKNKIILHYLNHWQNDRLQGLRSLVYKNGMEDSCSFKNHFKNLPEILKKSIVDYFYSDIFYTFNYFFKCFTKIKYELSFHLHPRIFTTGEFILKFNKKPHDIYFITYGSFSIGVNKENDWRELRVVSTKFIIGDYFLLSGIKSFVGFRAKSTVRGLGLPAHILKRFITNHNIDCKDFIKFVKSGYNNLLDDSIEILNFTGSKRTSISAGSSPGKLSWGRIRTVLNSENIENRSTSVLFQAESVSDGLKELKSQRSKLLKRIQKHLAALAKTRLNNK